MILMDSNNFDRQHYTFTFVRNDFLGNVPTAVFDVSPASPRKDFGRFFGRIWIETNGGNVVRFNGDFAGSILTMKEFYHFDSWRTNVQPNLWLPTSFYVEESDPKSTSSTLKFKAINYVWGYALRVPDDRRRKHLPRCRQRPGRLQRCADVSPLGAQREWQQQAEDNVVNRLFQAGLLDAPSDFDKTLEALANNILVYNNIQTRPPHPRAHPAHRAARVPRRRQHHHPLQEPASTPPASSPQTAPSRWAISMPSSPSSWPTSSSATASTPSIAFNDRLLFPSTSVFERIPMHHTAADNTDAAKKAMQLLSVKELADGQKYFGLYLQQLQQRVKALPALNQPIIGDGLVKSDTDNSFWMAAMVPRGIKLDMKDLKQQAAMPLASFLRFDPWTDQLIQMHSTFEPIITDQDKMPFEVTPVYLKLTYFKPPEATPVAAPPAAATNPPEAQQAAPPAAPAQ